MTSADPIAALRHATSSQHDILDSGLPLAKADATLSDYVDHLQMLARWLRPIDAWLDNFSDGPQGPGAPPKVDRMAVIAADLAGAGAALPAADLAGAGAALPAASAEPWPPGASCAYRWGVAYVVEGSQLGGTVLYKRLAGRLSPHPLTYLQPGADGPGPRWRAFMAALRDQVRSDAEVSDACRGAHDAFARILALGHTKLDTPS